MPQKENCCIGLCSFFWSSFLLGILIFQVLFAGAAANSNSCVPGPMRWPTALLSSHLLAATFSLSGVLACTKSQLMPTGEKKYVESWAQGASLLSRISLFKPGASAAIRCLPTDVFNVQPYLQSFLVGAPMCSKLLHHSHTWR